jgi:hypothetical protein
VNHTLKNQTIIIEYQIVINKMNIQNIIDKNTELILHKKSGRKNHILSINTINNNAAK